MIPYAGISVLQDLASIALVANTPDYLFRHTRQHPFTAQIHERALFDEIKAYISALGSKHSLNVKDELIAYAVACSLSLGRIGRSEREILGAISTLPIRWSKVLVQLCIDAASNDSRSSVEASWNPQTGNHAFEAASRSAAERIRVVREPLIVVK